MRPPGLASIGQIRLASAPFGYLNRKALSHPTAEHCKDDLLRRLTLG